MKIYQKESHCVWDCSYHVVIVPKYRKKALYGTVRKRVGEMIKELLRWKGIEVIRGKACPDHIHMLLKIPPKYSVSGIMGYLKGKSAIRIHNEMQKKRNGIQQKSFWSRGYCVSTVGLDEEKIKKYIENQWKKDRFIDGEQLDLGWN